MLWGLKLILLEGEELFRLILLSVQDLMLIDGMARWSTSCSCGFNEEDFRLFITISDDEGRD